MPYQEEQIRVEEQDKRRRAGGIMEKDNSLRHLSRAQLLDMLYEAVKEKEELEKELDETRRKLEEKEIKISEAGSIAEAALKLNGVFEQAQAAADQYLYNLRKQQEKDKDNRV